jgi:dimethylglycine catabolism A
VLAEAPDAVVLATGSELRPSAALPGPVPAIDVDMLLESGVQGVQSPSAPVLDDEGGFLAPTAAERLVAERFTVEIATTHPVVGAEIDPTQQPFVFRRLALAGVVMTPHLSGISSDADGVTLRNVYTERDERREGVGLVVMAGYRRAVVDLRGELTALRPELRLVAAGDALAPRTLLDAVAEGARAGADV